MEAARELLVCPACEGALAADWSCSACGACYEAPDGIPNLLLGPNLQSGPNLQHGNDARVDAVRRFYQNAPFPGYPPRDSLTWLRARAERSEFARMLDHAIPGDAKILEIGCGTGQMSLYLARANRVVIGADLTRGSLLLGAVAARRFGLDRVQFVETDLHRPGLRATCATGRDDRAWALQRIRAHPAPPTPLGRPVVGVPMDTVRSGVARSEKRASTA